jgi:thymidine kinase
MSLDLIIGPMFSGKSTEIIRRIRLAHIINKRVLVIKPKIDNRYDDLNSTKITSHAFEKEDCIVLELLEEYDNLINNYDIIIIDEGQFFTDLKKYVIKWVNINEKEIVVAGLDGDYTRNPIGMILDLIPQADNIIKLKSLCKECNNGNHAIFTHRKTLLENQKLLEQQIKIGGDELYIPLCRFHFNQCN